MLIDNKTQTEYNDYHKVFDFIKADTGNGALDLEMAYLTINALSFMNDEINTVEKFRLILRNLKNEDSHSSKPIDMLNRTDTGLGMKDSYNIELNIAKHDYEDKCKNLKKWFLKLWEKGASEKIELPNKDTVEEKQYIIELIKKTPLQGVNTTQPLLQGPLQKV